MSGQHALIFLMLEHVLDLLGWIFILACLMLYAVALRL